MRLSHINITMPKGGEDTARAFYAGLLGLKEVPKPESIRGRGGVWFDAGGLDIHVSVEENRTGPDALRHFRIGMRRCRWPARETSGGGRDHRGWAPHALAAIFFVRDPFGNRLEIHEPGAFRG